jgi:hypothetical protein
MNWNLVDAAEEKVHLLKEKIIHQEKMLEASRAKLKLAEEVLADRRNRWKNSKDYFGRPKVR